MRFAFLGYSGAVQLKGSDNASLLFGARRRRGCSLMWAAGACGKLRELGFDPPEPGWCFNHPWAHRSHLRTAFAPPPDVAAGAHQAP